MNSNKINRTVKIVTDLLARKAYAEIEKLSNGYQLKANEIEFAVKDYGREIIPLPDDAFSELDIIEVTNSNPKRWSVNVPIFTIEEGRSDLTLELTLVDTPTEIYDVEFDDLHVL